VIIVHIKSFRFFGVNFRSSLHVVRRDGGRESEGNVD